MSDFFESMAKVYARIISRENAKGASSGEAPAYTINNVPEELRNSVTNILEAKKVKD